MYFFFTQKLQCTFYHSYDFQPVVAYTVLSRPMSFEVMATPSRVPPLQGSKNLQYPKMFPKWLAMHNERAKFFAGFNCSTLTYFETRTSSAYLRPVLFSNSDIGVCGQLHVIPLVFLNSHISCTGI